MLKNVTRTIKFTMHYREGQLKNLSNFINQYKQKGQNTQVSSFIELIKHPNPFLLRQSYFFDQFSIIFKNLVPYFKKNMNQFQKSNSIHNIMLMYQILNIHRKDFFQLISNQQNRKCFQKMNAKQLSYVYKVLIQLHATDHDKQFLRFIKEVMLKSIINTSSKQKQNILSSFNTVCNVLKYNLMEKQFNKQEAQLLLNHLQDKILPKISHSTFYVEQSYSLLTSLFENIQIRNLKIKEKKFNSYLLQAQKIKVKKRHERHKSIFLPNKSKQQKNQDNQAGTTYTDRKYFVQGESVFQIIFSKFLDQLGYNFEQNIIIGSNQFDIIVKGKKYRKYFPFQNKLNQNLELKTDIKPITNQEWQTFKKMNDFSRIKIDQPFKEPIILSLNGPSHYIDSDMYGMNQVTRSQQMKRYYVKNKGYNRYATVNFKEWEKVHQEGVGIKQFIQNVLNSNQIDEL